MDKWLIARREILTNSGEEHIDLHMDAAISEVIQHVRFPMMTPAQLADLLLSPLSQSHTEMLVEKIRTAMEYHKDQLTIPAQAKARRRFHVHIPGLDPILFTPRLYTTESFCASLTVDHVPNLLSYHCRSLLFSTQKNTAAHKGEESSEWVSNCFLFVLQSY